MSLDSLARATSSFSSPRAPLMLFVSNFLRDRHRSSRWIPQTVTRYWVLLGLCRDLISVEIHSQKDNSDINVHLFLSLNCYQHKNFSDMTLDRNVPIRVQE